MISASLFMLSILVFVNLYLIFLVKNIAAGDLIYMNILAVMAILIFSGTSYMKQSSFRKLKRKLCEDPDEEAGILLDDFENRICSNMTGQYLKKDSDRKRKEHMTLKMPWSIRFTK